MTSNFSNSNKPSSANVTLLFLVAGVFVALAIFSSVLYFSGSLLFLGAALVGQSKSKIIGYLTIGIAIIYFLFVFGYGVGKDLATRDNKVISLS